MTALSLTAAALTGCATAPTKLGLAYSGCTHARHVRLLVDETWMDVDGERHVQQEIFESVYEMIDSAERFIVIDMFLLNDFGYLPGPCMRPLSQEMTDRLVAKRSMDPAVDIVFITDPINTVYGSIESAYFRALEDAGVQVVWTDLDPLRDSNPIYSKPWRLLVKPFGTGPGRTMANPLGEGRISLRSLLKLLNFKANHRKLVVTDKALLVASANPHSASSAHWNTALRVDGAGMDLALEAESAILRFSEAGEAGLARRASRDACQDNGQPGRDPSLRATPLSRGEPFQPVGATVELLTEIRIKEKALDMLNHAQAGDRVELTMFYLSEKKVMKALVEAGKRGCHIRVILDPNKDAFGRIKNGIPNRQSAARLVKAGIPVRWAETHGEQCHVKMLYVGHDDGTAELLLGSSNFTRRNLNNCNGEADLAVTASVDESCMLRAREIFDRWWNNPDGRRYTTEYATYEDSSRWRKFSAWWKETTGMGTF